jgi:HEAT repeat protein/TolA-binding protein
MKRITLAMMLIAGATTVWAQVPPTPPARPLPATPSPDTPSPARAPIARPFIDMDEMRMRLRDVDRFEVEAAREAQRFALEDMRHEQEMVRDQARIAMNTLRDTPMAPMPALAAMPAMAPFGAMSEGFRRPSPQWIQGDPADSAYRFAHDVLNRGDYGRAAALFREIGAKYPKSAYQNDLPYYEAYARYKIGTTDELHSAAKLLEPRASKLIGTTTTPSNTLREVPYRDFYRGRGASDNDAVNLYIRVNSALAQRGDRAAADVVAKAAQSGANTCDREDMDMRAEALNALAQMDWPSALPQIKKVLEKKDECSVQLRRRAVFLLGRKGDTESATLLGVAVKSDPSVSVRSDAITWLPKLQGDAGVASLEDLLRTEQDESIQRAAVRALVASDNAKARTSMRALIERKDAPIGLRLEAIQSFNNERTTADDAAYLRSLYARADNDRIKESIVRALGRIGGPENDAFVLGIIKNANEPSQVRTAAISQMMSKNMSIADIGKLYDAADARNIRMQLVNLLERRQEQEAADKLYDIAKNSTDQQVKMQAFNALVRRKDERTKQLLNDIVDGKRPPGGA